jgi:hypothetical protein
MKLLQIDVASPLPANLVEAKPTVSIAEGLGPRQPTQSRTRLGTTGQTNINIVSPLLDPLNVRVLPTSAAAEFSRGIDAKCAAPQFVVAPSLYEESVATGAFRKMGAGEVWMVDAQGNAPDSATVQGENDAPGLEPTANISTALESTLTTFGSYGQGLLAGLCLTTVIIVSQYQTVPQAQQAVALFVSPVQLTTYILSTMAWLYAADSVLRFRQAVLLSKFAVGARNVTLLASGIYCWASFLCFSIVIASVFASMSLDNTLRELRGTTDQATLDASQYQYDAWKALFWVRLAFCILGYLGTAMQFRSPSQVDTLLAHTRRATQG